MKPVAIVQHEGSVPPGSITGVVEAAGRPCLVVQAWRQPEWPDPLDLSALVVMGGTMSMNELGAHPAVRRSRDLMQASLEAGTPVLGVCLGSQMMAQVLGGEVRRADTRNAFFSPVDVLAEDPVVAPFSSGTPVLQFHEDTFTLPPGATALARSARSGLLQAFRHGPDAYAIQFHFEVDEPIVAGWCDNIGPSDLEAVWGTSKEKLLSAGSSLFEAQGRAGRELVRRFLGPGVRAAAGPEGPAARESA